MDSFLFVLAGKTQKLIGVREMLISTAVGGVMFSLLAGQPMMILGATGPMIIFEEAMYQVNLILWFSNY